MRNILIVGAGKSTAVLIEYLLKKAPAENLVITIGDVAVENAEKIAAKNERARAISLDIFKKEERENAVRDADIVISMLPARFHIEVARDCLKFGKNLVTASYVSEEMAALNDEVKAKNLVFMNEIGVDPGLDHMSAMRVIDRIRDNGGKILLFESFCGGLVAPESDTNLWNYKFTWNPRNVVVAGQGGVAKFLQEGTFKYIPYHRLFRRTEFFEIPDYGKFEVYANRNSLKYKNIYQLNDVLTIYRGTVRRVGFSKAWNMFVQLGVTDDSYTMENSAEMSYRDFVNSFLPYSPTDSVELKFRYSLKIDQDDIMWEKLLELDLFSAEKKVCLQNATPAEILQKILTEKWTLAENDKDLIVMHHKFGFEVDGRKQQINATMIKVGQDQTHTAMATTVGLPVGIATLKILNGIIQTPGVQIPTQKEVYTPILEELENYGIHFQEEQKEYVGYNP